MRLKNDKMFGQEGGIKQASLNCGLRCCCSCNNNFQLPSSYVNAKLFLFVCDEHISSKCSFQTRLYSNGESERRRVSLPTLSQFWSFKILSTTFPNIIKFAGLLILRLWNCERAGRGTRNEQKRKERKRKEKEKLLQLNEFYRFLAKHNSRLD